MKKWFKIIMHFLMLNTVTATAQVGLNCNRLTILPIASQTSLLATFEILPHSLKHTQSPDLQDNTTKPFPKIYDQNKLAFFCKIEVKLEKTAKFPVKFRLGNVDYVDRLEGKCRR